MTEKVLQISQEAPNLDSLPSSEQRFVGTVLQVAQSERHDLRLNCIESSQQVYQQLNLGRKSGILKFEPTDIVVKGIPTDTPNDWIHVWVEYKGVPIDGFYDDDLVQAAIAKAQSEGTIEVNHSVMVRLIKDLLF